MLTKVFHQNITIFCMSEAVSENETLEVRYAYVTMHITSLGLGLFFFKL